ncbi:MAG: chloride channel protein, partial [Asgard group archaeon]
MCASRFRILAMAEAEEVKKVGKWILISSLIGFVVGFAVVIFHYILVKSDEFCTNLSGQRKIVLLVFLLPTLGLFLSGLLTTLEPRTKGDGLNAVIDSYHKNWGKTRSRAVPVKLLSSSLTLGSGGSAGALGPAAQMGGNSASLIGDELKLTLRESRTVTACGMAATFSAIFAAPISGAVFACEVLYGEDIEYRHLNYAVISSIVAYFTQDIFLAQFRIARKIYFEAPESLIQDYVFKAIHIPIFILLGVTCAFFGILFVESLEEFHERFDRSPTRDYVKTAIGGLLTGIIALFVGILAGDLEKGTMILGL